MKNRIDIGLARLEKLFGYKVTKFEDRTAWTQWRTENPEYFSPKLIETQTKNILARGAFSAWLGFAETASIRINSNNLRESFNVLGFNPRQRAVLDLVAASYLPENDDAKIYAPERITKFAHEVSTRFPNFIGSEYIPDLALRAEKRIRHEDLADLSFPDNQFDLVIANEVFEHLPYLEKSLSEIARVLLPNGSLIATFPFVTNRYENLIKAKLGVDGNIENILPPEYHGNPVDPEKGSLVFQLPAWQIIDLARGAGFKSAAMIMLHSVDAAIITSDMAGVLIFTAQK